MNEYLIKITCTKCRHDQYFETDNLPGGKEHCAYCEECGMLLPKPEEKPKNQMTKKRVIAWMEKLSEKYGTGKQFEI